jgi:hypothetical protein
MLECPDDQELSAFLDDRLYREERARVEQHLAGCAACLAVVAAAGKATFALESGSEGAREAAGVQARAMAFAARWGRPARAAALVLAGLGSAFWILPGPGARLVVDPAGGVTGAVEAAAPRPVLPRLASSFDWAPPPVSTRGAALELGDDSVRELLAQLSDSPAASPERQLGNAGALYLLAGNLGRAVETLDRAVAALPDDGASLNDLAAAYLARGLAEDRRPSRGPCR